MSDTNRSCFLRILAIVCIFVVAANSGFAKTSEVTCVNDAACSDKETHLPLRALPRPNSNLYKEKKASPDAVLEENLTAFRPLYVFAREDVDFTNPSEPKGWYRVGPTVNVPKGWMQARDVMEWRQALVVSYTHPGVGAEGRKPILMFGGRDPLKTLVSASDRTAQVQKLYSDIDAGKTPKDIVSIEPKQFIDIEDTFYVLPVLDFETNNSLTDDARLLQIAAAVPGKRSDTTDKTILSDREYAKAATSESGLRDAGDLKIDVVFVMDMTNSMGPYIERTKQAITDLARSVTQDPKVKNAIRFGIVGYRDDVKQMPQLEFTAKNFTPTLLTDLEFTDLVGKNVAAATQGSGDYPEEVYAGVKLALDEVSWTKGALRFVVLIGDASPHEPGHPQNTTGLGAAQLRQMANDGNVYIFSIHLLDDRAKEDHAAADAQFSTLAHNPGREVPALFRVPTAQQEEFDRVVKTIAGELANIIIVAQKGGSLAPNQIASAAPPNGNSLLGEKAQSAEAKAASAMVREVAADALVNYLGSHGANGESVRDVVFWAADRDLIDPRSKEALSVRVLVTKEELNNLIMALGRVLEAIKTAEVTQMQFFASLQAVVAQTSKGEQINYEKAKTLSGLNLMPKWIESLPYRSTILDMNNQTFEALQPDERGKLRQQIEAKYKYYVDINEKVDAWKVLDPRANSGEKVYPLPLEMLP